MGAILGLHSITTRDLPGEGDAHVPLELFRRVVGLAQHIGEIVPLETLLRRHAEGQSTAGLVAITLDDAYAGLRGKFQDFVSTAAVPISVFVVTRAAETGARFWWDRIDDTFPHVSSERWRAFEDACGLPEEYRTRQPASYGPLRPLRQWLLAKHAGRWPDNLEPALAALETAAGVETRHRSMRFDELEAFAKLPNVEVGVHTVTHPVLPLLSNDEIRQEIAESYAALRARFERVLQVLAFPFALYDRRTVEVARAAGMSACLTLSGSMVRPHDDTGALSRLCLTKRDTLFSVGTRLLGLRQMARTWTGRQVPRYPDLPSAAT